MGYISSKVVKTRKEHNCFGCSRKFPKGSKLERVTGADGGTIMTVYWCDTCQRYMRKHMEPDETVYRGELKSEDKEGWELVRIEVEETGIKSAF